MEVVRLVESKVRTFDRAAYGACRGFTVPRERSTRVIFELHIVEHEDNDMMRPFTVSP
jgi:hypothetical protein